MPMDLSAQIDRLRTPGYRRSVLLRRLAAAALVLAAALHVLLSAARADPLTLTFARDVAPGTTLTADDVVLARLPAQAVPRGALSDPALAEGQVLAAAAAEGEVVTSVRLVGPDLAAALEPYWNTYSAGGFAGSFGAYLAENSSSVTADLAAIADGYVEGHDIGALKKLYTSARNKGLEVLGKHLGELGDTLEKFA